jgi:hypothetical protein
LLVQKIKKELQDFGAQSYFARLSTCAASEGVECHDVYDILHTLRDTRIQASLRNDIPYGISLFLREWVEMDHSREFRLFIYKNRLTAISQYSDYPMKGVMLRGNREEAKSVLVDFWEEIRHDIPYEDCLLDVYVGEGDEDGEFGEVRIIEFGSFYGSVNSAGLYCWKEDRGVLMGDEGGVDMRLIGDEILTDNDDLI